MVKISVIIPVYNVEKYLEECLNSVLNQTFKDIEVICVNDGSTDDSLAILKSYEKKDNRIRIFSQENKGQGSARNFGLTIANGDFIYFMDADDTIKLTTLEETYNMAISKDVDYVMFRLINYDEETNKFYEDAHYNMPGLSKHVKDNVFNYNDLGDLIFKIAVSPVNKLYNHDFLKSINAHFREDIIFEDNIFFWNVFFNAKKIFFIQKQFYIRRRHPFSTTGNANIKFLDTLKVHNLIFDIFKKYNVFDDYTYELFNKKVDLAFLRFTQVKKEIKPKFFEEMKKDFMHMSEEYSYDFILDNLNETNKFIFRTVITSKSAGELYILVKNYKILNEIKNLEKSNKNINKKIKKIKRENKLILSSNSWKLTKPIRLIINLFR